MVSKAMQDAGYRIIPVNPTVDEVLGEKAVASLKDIKEHVDIVKCIPPFRIFNGCCKKNLWRLMQMFLGTIKVQDEDTYQLLKRKKGYTVIMDRCIKVGHAMTK